MKLYPFFKKKKKEIEKREERNRSVILLLIVVHNFKISSFPTLTLFLLFAFNSAPQSCAVVVARSFAMHCHTIKNLKTFFFIYFYSVCHSVVEKCKQLFS